MRTTESEPASPPPLSPLSDKRSLGSLTSSLDALSLAAHAHHRSTFPGRRDRQTSTGSSFSSGTMESDTSSYVVLKRVFKGDNQGREGKIQDPEGEDSEEEVIVLSRSILRGAQHAQRMSEAHRAVSTPALGSTTYALPATTSTTNKIPRPVITIPICATNQIQPKLKLKPCGAASGRSSPATVSSVDSSDLESILSANEARSSINAFLLSPKKQLDATSKLRLWQGLCYELGLAYFPDSPPPASSTSDPSQPARPGPMPMPQTLSKCEALLKKRGHVNIHDYFRARSAQLAQIDAQRHSGSIIAATTAAPAPPLTGTRAQAGVYAELVYPSSAAMAKYTRKTKRFVPLDQAKGEALQPLLRDFGFRRKARAY